MRTFNTCAAGLVVLGAGCVLGQWSPPAKELLARGRANLLPVAVAPSAGDARTDDIADLIDKCDWRIRAQQTARDHAAAERRLLRIESDILRRWGEPDAPAQLARIAEVEAALDKRAATLRGEIEELRSLADRLRDLQGPARGLDPRPAWVDEARVRLRVAELDATPR